MTRELDLNKIEENLLLAIKENLHSFDSYYIVDLIKLKNEVDFFVSTFDYKNDIFSYSYKTNYVKTIVNYLDKRDFLSELVSPFEVDISKEFKINPAKIIYNGPLKDSNSISYVLNSGGIVNIDNIEEFELIKNLIDTNKLRNFNRIGLRISFENKNLSSRFGIVYNSNDYFYIVDELINNQKILFESLHIHYPQRDIDSFKKRLQKIMGAAQEIKLINKDFVSIDIGGGFPSRMPKSIADSIGIEKVSSITEFSKIILEMRLKYNLEDLKFIYEPGTAIAANSMKIVGNIKSINNKNNKIYLNTDLSKGLMGGLRNNVNYPFSIINKSKEIFEDKENFYFISGFTCVEGDILGSFKTNRNINVGDLLIFDSVGSYSSVFKSPFIRGDIPIFSWDGKNLELCRRSQTAKDLCDLYLS